MISVPTRPLLLMPWFGSWPHYLPLFLDGCRRNPQFEVCIFTDQTPPPAFPGSVKFVAMSLAEFVDRVARATGVPVRVEESYKLCDLKPAYGLAFQDYLAGRDFWGFGDLDLVWGDLGRFATPAILASHDLFTVRKEYVSGCLTLLRNNPLLNSLFMRSPDWQRVFGDPSNFSFDECAAQWNPLIFGARYEELKSPFCSFSEVVFQAAAKGEIRGYFETVALEDVHSRVDVTERGVFEFWVSYALFHFVMVKHRPGFVYPDWKRVPPSYHVSRQGFLMDNSRPLLEQVGSLKLSKVAGNFAARTRRPLLRRLGLNRPAPQTPKAGGGEARFAPPS